MKLVVPVAKGGLSLLPAFPSDEWEVAVAECSRSQTRDVTFWSRPQHDRYQEIVVVERRASTGLTQRHVATALGDLGVTGPIRFAASRPETKVALAHQNYLIGPSETLLPAPDTVSGLGRRYLVALVGLPAAGKTLLRYLLAEVDGVAAYKWGHAASLAIQRANGTQLSPSWADVQRFHDQVESRDRVAVARVFLESSGATADSSPFVVVDGVKGREQLLYVAYALGRPIIVVGVVRDEAERVLAAHARGDQDDPYDEERGRLLQRLGTGNLVSNADFFVETTGCETTYNQADRQCSLLFTRRFLLGMHELFEWIGFSSSEEQTERLVCAASARVARKRGYLPRVEVR